MNRSKVVLFVIAGLVAFALLLVGLAFTSGVQTWAVRRVLAGQPGLKVDVGQVSAGLSSAVLRDVRVEQAGTVIVAREVNATFSATDYLFGKRVNVGSVAVRGVEVDARKAASTPTSAAAAPKAALAPFAGILSSIQLPGEVRVGRLELEAKVLLADNRTAQVNVDGGGLAPGAFGTINWKVNFADAGKGAAVSAARAQGALKVRTTADRRVDSIEVLGEANATGPGLPSDQLKIAVKLEQPAANAGESIAAEVSLVRGAATEKLLGVNASYAAGKPVLDGKWTLAVRNDQFAAVLASLGLPDVALTGEGSFTYNLNTSAATTAGTVNGKISRLEKLGAELAAIGAVQLRAAFDGGSSKESALLNKLEFDVATDAGQKFIAVAVQQKLSFNFADKRLAPERVGAELARVTFTGVPLVWAQPVVKPRTVAGGEISGVFVVEAELDGSRVKLRATEPLTVRAATIREGEKTLLDRVTLTVSPSIDYAASRIVADAQKLSVTTPEGDTLAGALSAEIVNGAKSATNFSAQLTGRLAALVKPYLPVPTGPLTLAVDAKGRLEGNALQLSALKLQVDREGAGVLAGVEALQPLAIDLKAQKLTAPNAATPAARVRWGELPLAWMEPFVAQSKFAGQLIAGSLEVTLTGSDAVSVRALEAIAARGVSVALSGQEWLRGADLATDLKATWKGGTLSAEVQKLEVRQGTASVLTAMVAGEITPGKTLRAVGRGSVSADFAVLAQQPALAAQLPLLRGAVSAKFDGAVADGVTAKLTISGQNLVARDHALPLGSMELSVDAKLDATNSGTVRNSLIVTKDGRKSDLLVDGKVALKPGAISFEGRITGDQIIVDDMQAFSALGAPPPAASPVGKAPVASAVRSTAPAAKPAGPVKDTTPAWAGFAGRIDLDLKTIKLGTGITMKGLRGALAASPAKLTVENVGGQLNGNTFKTAAILNFDVNQARPYTMVGSLDVPGFDVGAFLRAADPGNPPTLETVVNVSSQFKSTGVNTTELQERVTGVFDFKGGKGVCRALNSKAETGSGVATIAGLAALALGAKGKTAEGMFSAGELFQLFRDIPFDSVVMRVERGDPLALQLKSFELLSPTLRLTGTGTVDHKPGTPFADSQMNITLQVAAKDRVANTLNQARLLDGNKDANGYYTMQSPIALRGKLTAPDRSAFVAIITRAGVNFLR